MKKIIAIALLFAAAALYGQQKYALVIGNSNYANITRLANPGNDANDMAAALRGLGFTVETIVNADLNRMESAIETYRTRLVAAGSGAYGFLYYAGHGVQSEGENYLLPVDANIPSESYLRTRAVSVQAVLADLEKAGNTLNVIVLDACRDNPFGWARGGARGLSVTAAPRGSIVMYATSANSTAADGTGRNGLFTAQLLAHLKTPGLEVKEVFNRTGASVASVSGGRQHPELSVRFFGSAYLGSAPVPAVTPRPAPAPSMSAETYFDRGEEYRDKGEYDNAIREYNEAIRLNRDYTEAYYGRGWVYNEKKEYDRALADLNEAIRLNPNYTYAYNSRGFAYRNKGDYDRAIADYNKTIQLDPNYAFAYNNRGDAYQNKGDYDRAMADYEAALRIDPNHTLAKNNLELARKAKAGNQPTTQIAHTPYPSPAPSPNFMSFLPLIVIILGICIGIRHSKNKKKGETQKIHAALKKGNRIVESLHRKENYDRAIADYEAALRIDPNHALAKNNLEDARGAKAGR